MALRWGIVSTGKISHDFVNALGTLPRSDHQVVAVAAQDLGRAKEFSALHKIPNAYQGYDQLAKNSNIDIIYVGNLNHQHYEVLTLMLENGRNVLCEKPFCLNYKQAKNVIDLARSKNLFLMEAVWSRFFPAYVDMRNLVHSGALGDILQVHVTFGLLNSHLPRVNSKAMGGGTVIDMGIYLLQFSQMVFGSEPDKVLAGGHLNEDGVDSSMSAVLTYPNGGTATISTHSKLHLPNEAVVFGTKGTAKLPMMWCPTTLQMPDGSWKEYPLPKAALDFNYDNGAGLRYQAEECRQCILKGFTESSVMSLSESLILAKLEDSIRQQLGVKYPQDD